MELKVQFLTTEAFARKYGNFSHAKELVESMAHISYSKMECYRDAKAGVIRIPNLELMPKPDVTFGFYMYEGGLIFLEEKDELYKRWTQIFEQMEGILDSSQYLLVILEELLVNDSMYLQQLEKTMSGLEEGLLQEKELSFFEFFMRCRKKLSNLHFYYEQMIDVGECMQTECSRSGKDEIVREWRQYTLRVERLHDYVNYLRDYGLQIRDLYQGQKDAKQNKVFNWLTIVTTLFLPLTLLTGWYGMNFSYMPEVSWKHGYMVVIGVAVAIIISEAVFIKKQKIL